MGTATQMPGFEGILTSGRLLVEAGRPRGTTLERPHPPIIRTCPSPAPREHAFDDRHLEDPERWDGMS
ncbi:MAG TPA: hypothetical protein PKB10_06075 [Tepidisphaeraceae bacterium]|nr:hypothetical protein [Tepidisphaeraceae bacterium]